MATSGTYTFALTVDEVIEEAFQRAGIDEGALKAHQKKHGRTSLNLELIAWQADRVYQWCIEQRTVTLTDGDATPTIDSRMLDIVDMVLRRDSRDTPMTPISRTEYLEIPNKSEEGRPDRYFLDRQRDAPVLYLWPTPENSTDIIVFNQIRRMQDIARPNASEAAENPDVHALWYDALCAGLAKRMALKFAPARYRTLKEEAKEAYDLAKKMARDKADTSFRVVYGGRGR